MHCLPRQSTLLQPLQTSQLALFCLAFSKSDMESSYTNRVYIGRLSVECEKVEVIPSIYTSLLSPRG